MELDNPIELLGPAEADLIQEATTFLKSSLPDKELKIQVTQWLSKNLQLQTSILSLRSQLRFTAAKRWIKLAENNAHERELLKNEGYRASGERDELVMRDSTSRDLRITYDNLNILADQVEAIEWELKSSFNLYGR